LYGCDDERKASIPRSNGNCREWSGWARSRRSGERLGASGRELHVSPALVQPQPTALDRELQPGAIFSRTAAARGEKGPVWRRPSCTGSTELAISISLRAAASGSAKGRGSTNFIEVACSNIRVLVVAVSMINRSGNRGHCGRSALLAKSHRPPLLYCGPLSGRCGFWLSSTRSPSGVISNRSARRTSHPALVMSSAVCTLQIGRLPPG
jgi:hypothetical protein